MNIYPAWWDVTITVYNKYVDPTNHKVSWYKHVLSNCFWKYVGNQVTVGATNIETDNTICRVPVNSRYREKSIWDNLNSTNKATLFTFGTGDIIIKGRVNDTIDEYTSGKRSSDILAKYKVSGCFLVERCADNTGGHRGNEHYYVRGV